VDGFLLLAGGVVDRTQNLTSDQKNLSTKCIQCQEIHFPVNKQIKSTTTLRLVMVQLNNGGNTCSFPPPASSSISNVCDALLSCQPST
jgi:hypothetical protein